MLEAYLGRERGDLLLRPVLISLELAQQELVLVMVFAQTLLNLDVGSLVGAVLRRARIIVTVLLAVPIYKCLCEAALTLALCNSVAVSVAGRRDLVALLLLVPRGSRLLCKVKAGATINFILVYQSKARL